MSSNKKLIKILTKMLSKYDELNYLNSITSTSDASDTSFLKENKKTEFEPSEFVKNYICERKLFLPQDEEKILQIFYDICSVRKFLDEICKEKNCWPKTKVGVIFLYLLLFYLNHSNNLEIYELLQKNFKPKSINKIKNFLNREDLNKFITDKASQIHIENEESCITNSKEVEIKQKILQDIDSRINMCKEFANLDLSQTNLDTNESEVSIKIASNTNLSDLPIPTLEAERPKSVSSQSKIPKLKKRTISIPIIVLSEPTVTTVSSTSLLHGDNTSSQICYIPLAKVKTNITQILREGAEIQKKTESDEKLLQSLCQGAFDPKSIETLLKQIKESEEEFELREIERKHLLGRISIQEARIAKLNAHKSNQLKACELKKQSKNLEQKLIEFKVLEEIRIRNAFEKSNAITAGMRNSQEKNLKEKRENARNILQKSKDLEKVKAKQDREDLERKIQLIRQIKALEYATINNFNTSFGRGGELSLRKSCEMSLEKLKNALCQMKERISDEISKRKEKIQVEKMRQQKLIEDTKYKIEKYKNSSSRINGAIGKSKKIPVRMTPELIELKNKLEMKKLHVVQIERNTSSVLI